MRFSKRVTINILLVMALIALYSGKDSFANIVLKAYYPVPYGEYQNAIVRGKLVVGTQYPRPQTPAAADPYAIDDSSAIPSKTDIFGNLTSNGNVTVTNGLVRINPGFGPYGKDGLRVSNGISGATSKVMVGSDDTEDRKDTNSATNTQPFTRRGTARFKANAVLAGQNLYAVDYTSSGCLYQGAIRRLYGRIRGYTDTTRTPGVLQKKGMFYGKWFRADKLPNDFTVPPGDITAAQHWAALRIDGYYVRLGQKMVDRAVSTEGLMNTVLIGTRKPDPTVTRAESLFLQVGTPNTRAQLARGDFCVFSSREFKKDITPFSPKQYADALQKISHTPVYRFRLKADPAETMPRVGLIAEDSPAELLTIEKNAVDISDANGFLLAALKGLKIKNDDLKIRLEKKKKKYKAL